jgi:predicted nucleic acid-binding protein
MSSRKVYWDTSCFIALLSGGHPDEVDRSSICEDVLQHARSDDIEIWTSTWTIVETVRPKATRELPPVPLWAELLNQADEKGTLLHPNASQEFEKIWHYYHRRTGPTRLLADEQALKIRQMFDWPWIRKIQVIPVIAHRAAEIARSHNMKPGDALHVASALFRNCDAIHHWDRHFNRTDDLIRSENPSRISPQDLLPLM